MDQTRLILVVEDELLLAMELDHALRRGGYQVLGPAPNVRMALELLREQRPDAAVLDVTLAGERVTPVAEVLRAMGVPFLLASGYGAADMIADAVLRDAVNLGKPLRADHLLRELSELLSVEEA